jgi:DNA ligase (NAD+)
MQQNESILANARNAATGAMRVKDSTEVVRRGLETFVYQIAVAYDENNNDITASLQKHSNSIDILDELGFKVPTGLEISKTFASIEAVITFCSTLEAKRDQVPYEIDGMVIKVDSMELQQLCGATSHHPRWATALKFTARQATSKLLSVEYQVGKVGAVTPVAKIRPVQLAGVTVSSISLHNEEFIQSRDIHINDTVLVERAGDVIPYIVKSFPELRDGSEVPIVFPSHCPSCSAELLRIKGEAAWRCVNPECEAQLLQKIIHFVSKDAMDIDGLGKQLIERFYQLGYIRSVADIFRLDYSRIQQLEGFGSRSAENLKAAIEAAKSRPLHRLLYGLGIHHVGKRASKLLTAGVKHLLELADKTEEDLIAIKDIGPVVAANIIGFFSLEKNKALMQTLESLGVSLANQEVKQQNAIKNKQELPLYDKSILFTGSLQQFSRKEAAEMAEAAGARVISAVSSKLDILVVGENAGSKLKKAQALGTVQILSEDEF